MTFHERDPDLPSFLVCHCNSCARETIAHRVLLDDRLAWACERCDTPQDERVGRWVSHDELDALGYFVDGLEPEAKHGGSGCRSGSCGISQPGSD